MRELQEKFEVDAVTLVVLDGDLYEHTCIISKDVGFDIRAGKADLTAAVKAIESLQGIGRRVCSVRDSKRWALTADEIGGCVQGCSRGGGVRRNGAASSAAQGLFSSKWQQRLSI